MKVTSRGSWCPSHHWSSLPKKIPDLSLLYINSDLCICIESSSRSVWAFGCSLQRTEAGLRWPLHWRVRGRRKARSLGRGVWSRCAGRRSGSQPPAGWWSSWSAWPTTSSLASWPPCRKQKQSSAPSPVARDPLETPRRCRSWRSHGNLEETETWAHMQVLIAARFISARDTAANVGVGGGSAGQLHRTTASIVPLWPQSLWKEANPCSPTPTVFIVRASAAHLQTRSLLRTSSNTGWTFRACVWLRFWRRTKREFSSHSSLTSVSVK